MNVDYKAKVGEALASIGLALAADGTLPHIDSLDVMNLVNELETAVGMMIPGDELVPKNFKTVDDIVALLNRMAANVEPSGGASG